MVVCNVILDNTRPKTNCMGVGKVESLEWLDYMYIDIRVLCAIKTLIKTVLAVSSRI